jgi:hypothetical protein
LTTGRQATPRLEMRLPVASAVRGRDRDTAAAGRVAEVRRVESAEWGALQHQTVALAMSCVDGGFRKESACDV